MAKPRETKDRKPPQMALSESGLNRIHTDLQGIAAALSTMTTSLSSQAAVRAVDEGIEQRVEPRLREVLEQARSEIASGAQRLTAVTRGHLEGLETGHRQLQESLKDQQAKVEVVLGTITPAVLQEAVQTAAAAVGQAVVERTIQPQLRELEDAYENADDRLAKLRDYVDAFSPGGLAVLADENSQLRATLERVTADLEDARADIVSAREEMAILHKARLSYEVANGVAPEELQRRLDTIQEAGAGLAERRTFEVQLHVAVKERDELRVEVERLQRMDIQAREADELERTAETLREDLAEVTRERDRARALADQHRRGVQRAKQEAQDLRRERAEHTAAIEVAEEQRQRIEELSARAESAERSFTTTSAELDKWTRLATDRQAQIQTLELAAQLAMERWQSEQSGEVSSAIMRARTELERWAETEADRLAAAVAAERDALQAQCAKLDERNSEATTTIEALRRTRDDAVGQLQAAQSELAHERDSLARLREVLHEENRQHIERQRTSLQTDMDLERDRVLRDAEDLAAQIDMRRGELATQCSELSSRVVDANAEVTRLAGQRGSLEGEVETLRGQIDELRTRAVPDEERIASLNRPVFNTDTLGTVGGQSLDEQKWLQEVATRIKKAGYVFPMRLIQAFHTSLKVAVHNPLTVLAGISGTGKSELPRLYAEAGGLPFLPMAVQPNWDSPHDLFGFFNYTDGRFKAEALARLLRQINDKADPLHASPVIVLLDEMNLARVEYYFAELLSKLEIRRSAVRSGTREARRRASVELDVGPGQPPVELFLDPRVLFVGTMNEDESTLTLSDKVLDRASVLHFPAPGAMSLQRQTKAVERGTRLSYEAWSRWYTESGDESVAEKLNAINKILEPVDRPFGHRLFRAIHAYIANHPAGAESDDAWADQFAMKLMPRLHGLETGDRAVRDALSNLERHVPEELREAFAASRDREYFAWRPRMDAYRTQES